jgi:hypothetical protein
MCLYMSHNPPLRCTATIGAHAKVAQASGTDNNFCSFPFEAFDEIPKENAKDLSGPMGAFVGLSWGFLGEQDLRTEASVN